MPAPARAVTIGLLAALAAIGGMLVAALIFGPDRKAIASLGAGTLLSQPRPVPEFTLTDGAGKPFTNDGLKGRWSVIFVGFTHCPDVCPNTLGLLKTVRAKLASEHRELQVVFLSVDPERDTPEVMQRYVQYFDPAFVGVSGPTEQLDKLGSTMGFVYAKAPGPSPDSYSIDHSSALILVGPKAEVLGYFTPPFKVEALVTDLSRVIAG